VGVARPVSGPLIRGLDDRDQLREYERKGIAVFKGIATLGGLGLVFVNDDTLKAERLIIATGSRPRIPAIPGLAEAGYWTNREATTPTNVPDSAIVLGGGPVGIELAQLLRRLDAEVHLIETSARLLEREDERVSVLVRDSLRGEGVDVRLGVDVGAVERRACARVVRLESGADLSASELILATGRAPRTDGLGLERVGIADFVSGIDVDERRRAADGVWAVGMSPVRCCSRMSRSTRRGSPAPTSSGNRCVRI